MPANLAARIAIIVAGVWSAGSAPTMGQCPLDPVWQQRHPAHSPSPRYGHAMAYDSARQVTVLFGGSNNRSTWEWDGTDWARRSMTGPPPRYYTAMAYDELRGVTVLFGGGFNGFLGDTWEWDGVHWTLRSDSGPPPRLGHAMVFDSSRGVTVMFGGKRGTGLYYGDTWEWDGDSWQLRSSTGPVPRSDHAMAYDAKRHVTVLYGGLTGSSETWEWDGQVWVRRTAFVGPEYRAAHSMAYDAARGATLLFSGLGPEGDNSQTWAWDGTTWTLLSEIGPPGRNYSAMAYDSERDRTVLFGGGTYSTTFDDTWVLPSCAVDSDGDGVPNAEDACPNSDLGGTLVIDGCDSGVANQLSDDGCTMADQVGQCVEGAGNHGAFVLCVVRFTREWQRGAVITLRESTSVRRCAAHSTLPLLAKGAGRASVVPTP